MSIYDDVAAEAAADWRAERPDAEQVEVDTTNRCDACGRDLGPADGGICQWCIQEVVDERNREWWSA